MTGKKQRFVWIAVAVVLLIGIGIGIAAGRAGREPVVAPGTSDERAETLAAPDGASSTAGPDTAKTTPPPADVDTSEDGRHFTYIRDVSSLGTDTLIVVDYAQMLTGAEAAAAATAAGEESPPPNDYFIVNENALLRTFSADTGMTVRLTSTSEGVRPEGYGVAFGIWQDMFAGMIANSDFVKAVPYWITIEGGIITVLEEQYLP